VTGAVAVIAAANGNRITLPGSGVSADITDVYDGVLVISASASITFERSGEITVADDDGTNVVGYWCSKPSSTVGDGFYVKFDYSGSALASGPADNTYVQLNTDRTWTLTQSGGAGSKSTSGAFYVALDGSGTGAQSCSGSLAAALTV